MLALEGRSKIHELLCMKAHEPLHRPCWYCSDHYCHGLLLLAPHPLCNVKLTYLCILLVCRHSEWLLPITLTLLQNRRSRVFFSVFQFLWLACFNLPTLLYYKTPQNFVKLATSSEILLTGVMFFFNLLLMLVGGALLTANAQGMLVGAQYGCLVFYSYTCCSTI